MIQEHSFVENKSLPKSIHKSVNWKINRAKASIRATIFARIPIIEGVASTNEVAVCFTKLSSIDPHIIFLHILKMLL